MNTRDLSDFGCRELKMAGDLLLKVLSNGTPDFLGDGIAIEFNPSSGDVFLIDDDGNMAMVVDGELLQFSCCENCGNEGLTGEDSFNYSSFLCDKCYVEENPDEFENDDEDEEDEEK